MDGLPPIVFKLFNNQLIQTLVSLFNKVLEDETYLEAWCTGISKPMYKKGSKKDPQNYRGISLLPIMGIFFSAIVADILTCWEDLNNKLNEAQFGFRKNRRTSDAIFILHTAIQVAKKQKKPLFTCFVDFAKAFDTINHHLLWTKLSTIGLSRKMLNILQNMYAKAAARVTINNILSTPFQYSRGVRQGCNLSLILFSLFISDLENHLSTITAGSIPLTHTKLHLLQFADDLVLLSDSHGGLQKSLDILSEYCATVLLNVNRDNTKIVIFNKYKREPGPQFKLNDVLETVNEYRYLGIVFTASGSFRRVITTHVNQAKKSLFSLIKTASQLFYPKPSLTCHLFDSLVRPVTEYGSEVWGFTHAEEIERVHRYFCTFSLGVPITTSNLASYGELRRTPLYVNRKLTMVKF